jgi:hypothetical protein
MDPAFGSWLGTRYRPAVVASRLANCRRVEDYYGDLDRAYGTARMLIVLEALRYSLEDERRERPNPSRVPINGNLREGLATLRHAVALYKEFRESAQSPQSAGRIFSPRPAAGDAPPLSGDEVLGKAASELGIDLVRLVAEAAIWADPNVVRARREIHPHAAFFPEYRRGKKARRRETLLTASELTTTRKRISRSRSQYSAPPSAAGSSTFVTSGRKPATMCGTTRALPTLYCCPRRSPAFPITIRAWHRLFAIALLSCSAGIQKKPR